jgi:hypothetical protein
MLKAGDRIKAPTGNLGTILSVNYIDYTIKWDEGLTVTVDKITAEKNYLIVNTTITLSPGEVWRIKGQDNFVECKGRVCQCGVDTLGCGKHSDWCEKHERYLRSSRE